MIVLDYLDYFCPKVPVVLVASSTKAKKRRKGATNNNNNNKLFNDVVDNGIIVDDIIVDTTGDNPAGFDDNGNVDESHDGLKSNHKRRQFTQVSFTDIVPVFCFKIPQFRTP